jgi:RNA polymerase sigma factor (sigma-70 family)
MDNEQAVELYKLANFILKKHNIEYDEDLIQELVIHAYSKTNLFDESKSTFSTFVCFCMEIRLKEIHRYNTAAKRFNGLENYSLDYEYDNDKGNTISYSDVIPVEYDYAKELDKQEILKQILPMVEEPLKLVYFEDKTQAEAAKILGVNQSYVSRLIKQNIQKIQEYCKEKGLEYEF